MANFIPPANWEGQGNYFLPKSHKYAGFEEKTGLQKQLWQPKLQTFFQMVFGSGKMKDQIIGVKVCNRWTDRQKNSLTPYREVFGFCLSVKMGYLRTCFASRGMNHLNLKTETEIPALN